MNSKVKFYNIPSGVDHIVLEDDRVLHQLRSTANYASLSKFVIYFTGGVNLQIEHHLFPNIPFRLLPGVQKIVKQTCHEFSLPYHEFPSFFEALKDHIRFLKKMGKS